MVNLDVGYPRRTLRTSLGRADDDGGCPLPVSSSFLARVCARLNVPRPPRGYRAKRKVGQQVDPFPLPPARAGDELEWAKDGEQQAARPRPERRVAVAPARRTRKRRLSERPTRHALLTAIGEYFDGARVGYGVYLKPYKRLLVDVFVTKATVTRALDVANELFLTLEDHGYRVVLAPKDQYCRRPEQLDYREQGRGQNYGLESWRPARPTVVFVGGLAFGMTLYEMTEYVDAHVVNGKWVRVSETPASGRRSHRPSDAYKTALPSGRLALRVWCASGWVSWEQHWRESRPEELPSKFHAIRRALEEAVPTLERAIGDAQLKAAEDWKIWEAKRHEEERRAAERRKAEAVEASRAELLEIVDRWALAQNMESFFTDAEVRAQALDANSQQSVLQRIAQARRLLGGTDPLTHFLGWQPPEDRCADFQTSASDEDAPEDLEE